MNIDQQNAQLEIKAKSLFDKLFRTAKRNSFVPERLFGRSMCILDLNTLIDLVPVESEYTDQIQDVPVDRILGTENRCGDFNGCFYPRNAWMESRWINVYLLMHTVGISEPVKLIEYGGYYFVRDGNHRVSVALHSGIEYLTAEVVHYKIPISLPETLDRNNLALFSEKYGFQKRTGIFDYADENLFCVHRPESWRKLEKEIFQYSKSWFVRKFGREPFDDRETVSNWLPFYAMAAEHIRQRSLLLLFPGMCETDVFVALIEYWNSYEDPDSFWVGEIFEKFERYIRRRRVFLVVRQLFTLLFRSYLATAEDEKRFFLRTTYAADIIPGLSIPVAGKRFFSLCYRQIFRIYAREMMSSERKQPMLDELVICWYESFYGPVLERYRKYLYPISFERYYDLFSKRYFQKIISERTGIEPCFTEFEKRLVR